MPNLLRKGFKIDNPKILRRLILLGILHISHVHRLLGVFLALLIFFSFESDFDPISRVESYCKRNALGTLEK
ncbi:hypothetical protein ALGA_3908 [Labilibaculum antarcticum]|uniref:Uncharacterized protein n=1 Tax=Labilibaculum antarcticum TaxID=1717717 RepID=A0A1Y1CPK5_9BACT|nr:hypothetical protein ALGA_3908 [Labilibaculum antarcticum]